VVDAVKARTYRSTLRAEQATQTRRRIRAAADALFLERGYTDVSMDDVARAAGVARQTVFSAYGSKAKLFHEVIDVRIVGDDEPVPLGERPEFRRVLAAADASEAIRRQAALMVAVASRVSPLWPALVAAAQADAEIAEMVRAYDAGRRAGMAAFIEVLARLGALRRGRSKARLADAIWLLGNAAVVHAASSIGWTRPELERWYQDCLSALVLERSTTT
jgi:AcrR family transcriptional regulator